MEIAIIKYNAGNIQSVAFALDRIGAAYKITDSISDIQSADKVIFPGVGEASTTMNYLKDKHLDSVITNLRQPTLGICLGMQLMCSFSEENNTRCLGIFNETVRRFQTRELKVPHMGWNTIRKLKSWPDPASEGNYVYFVHSYYVPVMSHTTAETTYDIPFSAALKKDNFFAVQFHPEKSSDAGLGILKSFLSAT